MREKARQNADLFIQRFFKIRIKAPGSPMVPFRFRHAQIVSRRLRNEDRRRGLPIRHFYLKSRQVGQSTDTAADCAAHTWSHDNYEALIIAHDKKRAGKLFAMTTLFYDELPIPLQIPRNRDTTERLQFRETHSGIGIMTAENFNSGRGDTIQEAHISELGYYSDALLVLQNLEQLLPMVAGTQGVIETTANGAGTPAHEIWKQAEENATRFKRGLPLDLKNPYKGFFHAWQDDPVEQVIFENDRHRDELLKQLFFEFPSLKDRMEHYDLTAGQIAHYGIYLGKCFGDELLAMQEYPCDPEEAWISSGTPIFPSRQLIDYWKAGRPGTVYYLHKPDLSEITRFQDPDELEKAPSDISRNTEGYLEIWQRPVSKRRYAIGADSAAGFLDSDFSSAYVIDMYTLEMCAEIHGRLEPSDFATLLKSLGTYYNNALIGPEIDGPGLALLSHLKDYFNIYFCREESASGIKITNKMGWRTSVATRPGLIINAKRIFLERAKSVRHGELIRSRALVEELKTFVQGPTGKPQAAPGCHDDRVMAWAITLLITFHELYNSVAKEEGTLPGPVLWTPENTQLPKMSDVMTAIMEGPRGWAKPDELFYGEDDIYGY